MSRIYFFLEVNFQKFISIILPILFILLSLFWRGRLKKKELKCAYIAMSEDEEQNEIMCEWESTINDGNEE